jgi:hypothetical protein
MTRIWAVVAGLRRRWYSLVFRYRMWRMRRAMDRCTREIGMRMLPALKAMILAIEDLAAAAEATS